MSIFTYKYKQMKSSFLETSQGLGMIYSWIEQEMSYTLSTKLISLMTFITIEYQP